MVYYVLLLYYIYVKDLFQVITIPNYDLKLQKQRVRYTYSYS